MNRFPFRAPFLGFLVLLLSSPAVLAQEASLPTLAPPAPAAQTTSTQDPHLYSGLPNSPARFGLGLNISNMVTGVTAKLWAASTVAFQGAVGEGAEGNNLRAHLDMLFCPGTWASSDGQYVLPVYLGIGGVLVHDFAVGQSPSATEGGFRIPLGMSVLVRGNPIELFFEIAPEFTVRSNAAVRGKYGVYTDGAIGARYYF